MNGFYQSLLQCMWHSKSKQDAFCFACGRPLRTTTSPMHYPTVGSASNTLTGLLPFNHLLKQRYLILDQLGKGGFGAVYKAEDTQFGNRLVAVKEMSQRDLKTQQELAEATDTFKREALMLAGLRHQNLPRIYDHFSDGGRWYLVMDYIEGETLGDHLNKVGGHLSVEEAIQTGIQLCTVLDYLHTRQPPIIFRDLTPNNIMLTPDGHLYLIDFGIARLFNPGQAKDTTAFGTLGYAAPELLSKQTTPQSDIYSLGAILHQMLTGIDPTQTPFRFAPVQLSGNPALLRLSTLVMQMLDMDEARRPSRSTTIKQELQQISVQLIGKTQLPPTQPAGNTFSSATVPVVIAPLPSTPPQHTQGRNRKIGIATSAIAVIVILAFLIPALLKNIGQPSSQPSLNNSTNASTLALTTTPVPPTPVPPTPVPPTPTPQQQSTSYPSLAPGYNGTVHNITCVQSTTCYCGAANCTTTLTLASIVQNQQSISGNVVIGPGLGGSGPFTGTMRSDGSVNFTDTPTDGSSTIIFSGLLHADGH